MYYEGRYDGEEYYTRDTSVILSHENNPTDCDDDFYCYEIAIDFEPTTHYKASIWCDENCCDKWLVGIDHSAFINEEDAMAFKLAWT